MQEQQLEQTMNTAQILARRMLLDSSSHIFEELPQDPQYLKLEYALSLAIDALIQGSTCVDLKKQKFLQDEELQAMLSALRNSPTVCHCGPIETAKRLVPLVLYQDKLYLEKYAVMESRCAHHILTKMRQPSPFFQNAEHVVSVISELMTVGVRGMLSPYQLKALLLAATHSFTVLAGGPGTGKTTVVVRMLEVVRQQAAHANKPLRIHLVTPTGKAAQRLQESIYENLSELSDEAQDFFKQLPTVSTIHSLLKQRSRAFVKVDSESRPQLEGEVFVIDEVSMIPLQLMLQFLEALPKNAQLILVGDPYQLASVEAGTVIADIIDGMKAYACSSYQSVVSQSLAEYEDILRQRWESLAQTRGYDAETWLPWELRSAELGLVELQRAHRFTGDIASLVYAIKDIELTSNERNSASAIERLISSLQAGSSSQESDKLQNSQVHLIELTEQKAEEGLGLGVAGDQLLAHFSELEELVAQGEISTALEKADNMRLLCAQQVGFCGAESYNRRIAQELARRNPHHQVNRYGERLGCVLMVTKNDCRQGISNGDTGVLGKDASGRQCVYFLQQDRQIKAVSRIQLDSVVPAYAITIHKSQGSQYRHTVVRLTDLVQSNLNTRELLYTAVSRAKEELSICSNLDCLKASLSTRITRASGLLDKLMQSLMS